MFLVITFRTRLLSLAWADDAARQETIAVKVSAIALRFGNFWNIIGILLG
jgi:hypothetical protein